MLAVVLAERQQYDQAERTVAGYLDGDRARKRVSMVPRSVRSGERAQAGDEERALLHAHFLRGWLAVRKTDEGAGAESSERAIRDFRLSIAFAKYLYLSDSRELSRGWANASLPAPGCRPGDFSSHALYANLIGAYLRSGYEDEEGLVAELSTRADERHPVAARAVELAQDALERDALAPALVWAVANVNELLVASGGTVHEDSGLAIALVLEDVVGLAPAAERAPMVRLIERARAVVKPPPDSEVDPRLDAALKRLALLEAIRTRRSEGLATRALESLGREESSMRALGHSLASDAEMFRWIREPDGLPESAVAEAEQAIGRGRAGAWAAAARQDLAATLVAELGSQTGRPDSAVVYWAYGLLRGADPPAVLEGAYRDLPESERTAHTRWLALWPWLRSAIALALATGAFLVVGAAAGALAWLVELQLDRRRSLFTSFYLREMRYLAGKK